MLYRLDRNLHEHLISIEFVPGISFIRWFRVLLCRETTVENIMPIWDYILSDAYKANNSSKATENVFTIDDTNNSMRITSSRQ